MKRVITGTFLAATFAVGLSAQAPYPAPGSSPQSPSPQSPSPQSPSPRAQPMQESKDAAKSVTVTGCLKAGDSADTFVLSDLKWSDKAKGTGTVGTSGSSAPSAAASATTLKIIPSPSAKFTDHVGHTVEVTGTISDKDKADRAPSATPADPAAASSGPSFEARTVKMVSETCAAK